MKNNTIRTGGWDPADIQFSGGHSGHSHTGNGSRNYICGKQTM